MWNSSFSHSHITCRSPCIYQNYVAFSFPPIGDVHVAHEESGEYHNKQDFCEVNNNDNFSVPDKCLSEYDIDTNIKLVEENYKRILDLQIKAQLYKTARESTRRGQKW